jgi:hypothetical protein
MVYLDFAPGDHHSNPAAATIHSRIAMPVHCVDELIDKLSSV